MAANEGLDFGTLGYRSQASSCARPAGRTDRVSGWPSDGTTDGPSDNSFYPSPARRRGNRLSFDPTQRNSSLYRLGEGLLDGVEVGGVFRQEEKLSSCRADELAHGFAFVAAEIVHDHDITRAKRWEEDLLHVETKAVAIDRTFEKPWRIDPVVAQCRQKGHGLPAAVWNLGGEPAATWRPSAQRSHVGPGPGLVDEDQPLRFDATLIFCPLCPPPRDVGTIAFASHHAFF